MQTWHFLNTLIAVEQTAISRARKGKQMPGTCKAGRSGAWVTGSNKHQWLEIATRSSSQLAGLQLPVWHKAVEPGQTPAHKVPSVQQTEMQGTMWPSKGWAFLWSFRYSLLLLGQQCCSRSLVVGAMSRGLWGIRLFRDFLWGRGGYTEKQNYAAGLLILLISSCTLLLQRFRTLNGKYQPSRDICPSHHPLWFVELSAVLHNEWSHPSGPAFCALPLCYTLHITEFQAWTWDWRHLQLEVTSSFFWSLKYQA